MNRLVLRCDLKSGNELMLLSSGGKAFQRWGAERLKALCPMVMRLAEGTDSCTEEEDLREREGVGTWMRSDRYGGAKLWMALNDNRRTLNLRRN